MSENTRLMSERRRERTNTNKCWLATGLFVESHIWHVYWIAQTAYKFRQLCMVDGCLPFFSSSIFPNSSATLKWKPSRIPEAIVAIVIMHVAKYSMTSQLKRSYSWFYHRRRSKHSWHCNLIRGYFSFLSQCWANALSIQVVSAFISFVHFVGRRPWQRAWTKEVPENVFKAISAEFRCIVTSWKCKHLQILWLHFAWTENSRHSRYIE